LPTGSLSTSASAEIRIDAKGGLAEILEGCLLPEVERPASQRSIVEVEAMNGTLFIHIDASDVVALRAAVNSYLRWVSAVQDVVEKIR
jgi:tRNA threonylcarbamoyladenosine modification (KEOPS) complex  Pcc1 subunit